MFMHESETMNQEAAIKLTRARATLILDQPFFGALALKMPLIEDTGTKTLSVNGKVIKYNPEFINGLSAALTKSAMAHEVMHCVLDTMGRKGGRDHKKWNQATDYANNQILEDAGFEIGENWLLDPAYKGMSADEIYSKLPDAPPGGGDGGDSPGNGHGDPLDDTEQGEVDPAAQAEAARDWKVATIQAASAAKIMGKLPATLERFIDGLLKPQVDWKATLRRFVTERSKDDYSWMRPNKAMLVHGVYMPSLYNESMGDIVIGVDTSGSIDQRTLNAFSAECESIIAETMPANVHVVYCDAAVNKVDTFARHDAFALKACGGGGTAFKPVFDEVEKRGLRPTCLIYLTDLFGPTGFAEPEYPTLWVSTSDEVAPWGETVQIEVV
jgi:predicted metal-dependent peptidase